MRGGGEAEGGDRRLQLQCQVVGKFSVRIVPDQTPEGVEEVVLAYCNKIWANRRSPNKMVASNFHGGRCWLSDPDHPNYIAGSRFVRGFKEGWRNALPAGLLSGLPQCLNFSK